MVKSISFLLRKANQKQEAEVFFGTMEANAQKQQQKKNSTQPYWLVQTLLSLGIPKMSSRKASVTRAGGIRRVQIPSE